MTYTKKICARCKGEVLNNLSILCEYCSNSEKKCAICLKKTNNIQTRNRGCNCGK